MRWSARGGAEVHRRPADRPRGLRRSAPQGVLAGGHRVQGVRLLPDRQPKRLGGVGARVASSPSYARCRFRFAPRRPRAAATSPGGRQVVGRRHSSGGDRARPLRAPVSVRPARRRQVGGARSRTRRRRSRTSGSSAAPVSTSSSPTPRRCRSRPVRRAERGRCWSARWPGRRVAFLPRHGRTTGSRRTRSRIAPTCGRSARSACGASCAERGRVADRVLWPRHADHPRPAGGPDRGRVQTFYDEIRGARPVRRPVLPVAAGPRRGPPVRLGARQLRARSWSSTGRGSPPARSRGGTPPRAGR